MGDPYDYGMANDPVEMEIAELEKALDDLTSRLDTTIAKASYDDDGENEDFFDQLVHEIAKRDNCSTLEAMSKARREFPDDFELYQSAGRGMTQPMYKAAPKNHAVENWENAVSSIMGEQKKPSRTAAMSEARRRYPNAYAAYQAAT